MYIKQIKKPSKMINLLVFDTESILNYNQEEKKQYHNCYMICSTLLIRDTENHILIKEKQEFYFNDYKNPTPEFWNYILKTNEEYPNLYICSHNAKYDTLIIKAIKYLIENNYEVQSVSFSNPFFIFTKKEKQNINFFSTTNIFQTSIKKLGDLIGLEKLDFDYFDKKPPLDIAVKYCNRDVEIITITLIHYFNFLHDNNFITEKMTVASQSFAIYRQSFLKDDETIDTHRIKKIIEMERNAYHGGRTEVFKFGKYKNIYVTDINSMYPYIMKNFKVPVKKVIERSFLTVAQLKELMQDYYCIAEVYIKNCNEPVFPKVMNNKLCFVKGNFWTTLNHSELEFAIEHNYIANIMLTACYKQEFIFTEFVDFFYTKRNECKLNNDEVYALFFKYIMNSLYGKFGQSDIKLVKRGEVTDKDLITEFMEVTKDENGKFKRKKIIIFGGYEWEQENKGNSYYACPFIASAITANARMLLYKFMKIVRQENLFYCDTDSLFTNEIGYNNLLNENLISETDLGKLKLEKICKTITINNVKDYDYITTEDKQTRKKKGINIKTAKEIEPNKFEIDYWSGYSNMIHNSNWEYYTEKRIKKYSNNYNKANKINNQAEHFILTEKLEDYRKEVTT